MHLPMSVSASLILGTKGGHSCGIFLLLTKRRHEL